MNRVLWHRTNKWKAKIIDKVKFIPSGKRLKLNNQCIFCDSEIEFEDNYCTDCMIEYSNKKSSVGMDLLLPLVHPRKSFPKWEKCVEKETWQFDVYKFG